MLLRPVKCVQSNSGRADSRTTESGRARNDARRARRSRQPSHWSCKHGCVQRLPDLLRSVRREAPHVAIDIREMEPAEQVEALRREAIDIGLLSLSIQDPAFDSLVVPREHLIVALRTGHAGPTAGKVRLSELEAETFLIPRRQPVSGFHEVFLATLRSGGAPSPRCSRRDCSKQRCS